MTKERDKAPFDQLITLRDGAWFCVLVEPKVEEAYRELKKVKPHEWKRLNAIMQKMCDQCGHIGMPPQKFRSEGRGDADGVLLWAFKVWQFRLYGFIKKLEGKETFIGVDFDDAKKQNKADQDLLNRAQKHCKKYL